ncbi:hypothetical protein BGZ99_003523 [Dissophora globulifera]|uniref:Uncharacterized protein n=1 Tax=Dissophora globulifera TaxID=979702 RepID=A0A9P6UVZ0_9FUNG|nr:hypothetical protein BGZ99_003523 [Dissophora globulifera]
MESLTPLLVNFLEEHARPHVQTKVTEEIDETKVDLKQDLPGTIMENVQGEDSNPLVAQVVAAMGDKFLERVKRVTDVTVETASEGMDLLLTNGVMNIARGIIVKSSEEEGGDKGGFNFDFLKQGRDGMVKATMAASAPVIKQVSDNIGRKIRQVTHLGLKNPPHQHSVGGDGNSHDSVIAIRDDDEAIVAHFPAAIGGSIQEMIDEHGGSNGALGMAAGFMAKFMGGDGPGEVTVAGGGTTKDVEDVGGHTGGIQRMLQNLLAPKILLMIQPYLQRFEAKMTTSLETELRSKVFSPDYIKQTVMEMLTGGDDDDGKGGSGGSGFGNLIGAFLHKNDRDEGGHSGGQGGSDDDPMKAIGNLASKFFSSREG